MNPNELTPKQQTSEAVRQAENILILTGQHPSVDQVAATIALAAVLRKFGKKVTAIISDPLPVQAQFLTTNELDRGLGGLRDFILKVDVNRSQVDKLRYVVEDGKLNIYITPQKGGFAPSDVTFAYGDYQYDLAIILGVPTRARIDKMFADNQELFARLPIANIDFHRSNENYGAINLIDPVASSLSEILVALSESLQSGLIDETIATALLAGIMSSTDRFTATHTTSKSLTVAAQMMAAGAKQQAVVRGLFRDGKSSDNRDNSSRGPRNDSRREQPVNVEGPVESKPTAPAEVTSQASVTSIQPDDVAPIEPEHPQLPVIADDQTAEPIIDPYHIEVDPAADEVLEERMLEQSPVDLAHDPDGPNESLQEIPMADFAAAAEVLLHRDQDTPNQA